MSLFYKTFIESGLTYSIIANNLNISDRNRLSYIVKVVGKIRSDD